MKTFFAKTEFEFIGGRGARIQKGQVFMVDHENELPLPCNYFSEPIKDRIPQYWEEAEIKVRSK